MMGTTVEVAVETVAEPPPAPGSVPRRAPAVRRLLGNPGAVAVLTWLIATPVAVLVTRRIGFSPFDVRGAFAPLAAGGVLLAVMCGLARWRRAGAWIAGMAAGLFAAWLALALQSALNGTPFGFWGLAADKGRMTAAATRLTVTPWPADGIVDGLPSEYPPLYPWLIGRAALILDVPAWRLLASAEVLLMSFAVLAAFLLWRRLMPPAVALVCASAGILAYGEPFKPFSIITLLVFIPWLIATFANPPRGRLHWLPAGVIGGLIMLTYFGWFPFGAFGIVAIVVAGWRRAENRRRYVVHVLRVVALTAVISAPYLVPYWYVTLTGGSQVLSDLYVADDMVDNGFPFLAPTLLGALQLLGLAGLIWYRRSWWAWPLLYLLVGAYLYWLILGTRFVLNGHTMLFSYVTRLSAATLVVAGVLTVVNAVPALVRRFGFVPPRRAGAAVTAVALLWVGFTYWHDWRPRTGPGGSNFAAVAHLEPLPDCSYPKYVPRQGFGCLPVDEIRAAVERVLGPGARPRTLSPDERLFAFLPWRGYMGVDRTSAGSLVHWDDRHAELVRLSSLTDPAEFAGQTAATRFGPIDVFVLSRTDLGTWDAIGARFAREQFDPAVWAIADDLSQPYVVAIRRP